MARARNRGSVPARRRVAATGPAGQTELRMPDRWSADRNADLTGVRNSLGLTIRGFRRERGLSTRRLAVAVGVTSGFISQVENGQAMPSLATLLKIAAALNVRIGDLFHAKPTSQIVRRGNRPDVEYPALGMRDEMLSQDPNEKLEVLIGYIAPGGGSGEEPYTHGAETEFILMLAGEIELTLGEERHRLGEGDAITFSGDVPHAFVNPGQTEARVIWVYTPVAY
jgi:transcriptional regulator with XRE-family HTH domain